MKDVLALYALPSDEHYATVCLDETPVVLHADVRRGTANRFAMVEPLAGWRRVSVTERHTKRAYTEVLSSLVEERYPEAECICVVKDHLNTQGRRALRDLPLTASPPPPGPPRAPLQA